MGRLLNEQEVEGVAVPHIGCLDTIVLLIYTLIGVHGVGLGVECLTVHLKDVKVLILQ